MARQQILSRTNPLTPEEKDSWFKVHLPYIRVSLTNHLRVCGNPNLFGTMTEDERHRARICTYEIGVVTCRRLIEFLGMSIAYKPYRLIEKRDYYQAKEDGKVYEVKVIDLGGKWVEINTLSLTEKDLLTRIYLTGHRASVHLTDSSPYQGEWEIFDDAVKLVDCLLKKHLFDEVGLTPSTQ